MILLKNQNLLNLSEQIVDERNKVKYLYCDFKGIKQLIPCKPSGIILNLKVTNITDLSNKYINNIDITIKVLKIFNKINMDLYQKQYFIIENLKEMIQNIILQVYY